MKNFLEPKTVAIIGASEDSKKVGHSLMKNLENFAGNVVPINIKRDTVLGKKAYKSVLDYPEKIDLVIVAIPAPFVANILEECSKKEIKDVIVISAGFSEVGNKKDEEKIMDVAKKHKINLLGPNCFGVCNPYNGLDTTFALKTPEKGSIAFISQSGALWSYISDFSVDKFGFSGFVSLGNMAGVDFTDFVDYFREDDSTKAIILYVEKLKEGKKFIDVCKKCKKPMYVIKVGSSREGEEAAVSHTASLASDFEIYKGAFKQAEVELCDSLVQCFERASKKKMAVVEKKMKIGKKAVIITNAGGAGALATDYCENNGIDVVKKPIDLLGTALAPNYNNALEKLKEDNSCDTIIVILTPQKMSEIIETASIVVDFSKETKKNVIACFLGGESVVEAKKMFEENNVPCFATLKEFRKSL